MRLGTLDSRSTKIYKLSTLSYVKITAVKPWDFGAVMGKNKGFLLTYKKINSFKVLFDMRSIQKITEYFELHSNVAC